jgi:hypothetical protein
MRAKIMTMIVVTVAMQQGTIQGTWETAQQSS